MNLPLLFSELLISIGFQENDILVKWEALKSAYSKKSRYYHNLIHIEEMVAQYEMYHAKLTYPKEVLYAIFYHDYIYKATSKENELKSAEYAIAILPKHTNIDKDLVYEMILATKLHQHQEQEDSNWLIDFDLKILAKEWNDYQIYCNQIRKEYKIYPDFLYQPGRKKALEHFLENPSIFQTEEYKILFEKQARENIEKEIQQL